MDGVGKWLLVDRVWVWSLWMVVRGWSWRMDVGRWSRWIVLAVSIWAALINQLSTLS